MGVSDFDKFIIDFQVNRCLTRFNQIKNLDISAAVISAIKCLRDPLAENEYGP